MKRWKYECMRRVVFILTLRTLTTNYYWPRNVQGVTKIKAAASDLYSRRNSYFCIKDVMKNFIEQVRSSIKFNYVQVIYNALCSTILIT